MVIQISLASYAAFFLKQWPSLAAEEQEFSPFVVMYVASLISVQHKTSCKLILQNLEKSNSLKFPTSVLTLDPLLPLDEVKVSLS